MRALGRLARCLRCRGQAGLRRGVPGGRVPAPGTVPVAVGLVAMAAAARFAAEAAGSLSRCLGCVAVTADVWPGSDPSCPRWQHAELIARRVCVGAPRQLAPVRAELVAAALANAFRD